MDSKDFKKFSEYMSILGEIVGNPSTDSRIKIYWKILSKYPAEQVFAGFERLLVKPKLLKFPVPGDIIEQFTVDAETEALKAWNKARYGIRKAGYMNSVKFDDPVIHNVIHSFGGWKKFCSLDEREERFFRPQFLKAYALFVKSKQQNKLPKIPYLPGEAEISNTGRGLKYEPPVFVDDKTMAKALDYQQPPAELPEKPEDIIPPEEAKANLKALISNLTQKGEVA